MDARLPILCLGSGAALSDGRLWNSLLIDGRILLELPTTSVPQMLKLGIDPTQIETIFISHLHADHMFGLPFLLLEYCVRRRRTQPLYIVGPTDLEAVTFQLCDLAWPDLRDVGFEPHVPLHFVEIPDEGTYTVGDLSFETVRMNHYGLSAFGFRFRVGDRLLAYSGDTGDTGDLDRLYDGVDVAIVELTHPHASEDPGHLDAPTVRRLADSLRQHGTKIFATHINGSPDPIEGVTLCEDGKTYWVP